MPTDQPGESRSPARPPADAAGGDQPPTDADGAEARPSGARAAFARAWPILRWPALGFGVLLLLVMVAGAWLWQTTELPDTPPIDQSAVLLDRNGEELAVLAQAGMRLEAPLDAVAPVAIQALIAAEDQRFYDHTGIDPVGIGRAFWNNLTEDSTQGGSTITQQLVKNTYLSSDRTVTRKVREAVLAVKLERTEDKDDILERYLNTVYFGRGAYGIEAAARTYFDSSAGALTAEQAALLMGLLRSPHQLDPGANPDGAKARRDAVLGTMAERGALTADEARTAQRTPMEVTDAKASPTTLRAGVGPHFVEQVRAQLVERFGEQALYDQGLVVHTTLDIADQRAAEAAVATHLDDPGDPQAAVVGVDRSGAVRAWVGGRDFAALQVDLVTGGGGSGRQPGSTFKPIALAAHLDEGRGAGERFPAPSTITLDVGGPEPWEVSNAGGSGYGSLTLAQATAQSVNTVYAQVAEEIGGDAVVDMAGRLGVSRPLEPHASIVLGAQEVSPLEMATVYSTLSRSGTRIDPFLVTSVTLRSGEVLWEHDAEPEEVVDPAVADTVSAVLEETPRRGTARRAALDRPMAAKTGTTQRNADAWLAGYTPEYTAIVWVGNTESNEPIPDVDGMRVQGGTVPAMIWHDFMVEAMVDVEPTPFPDPDSTLLGDPVRRTRVVEAQTRTTQPRRTTTVPPTAPPSTAPTTEAPVPEPDDDDEGERPGRGNTTTTTTAPPTTTTTTAPPTTTTTAPPTTTTTAPPSTEESSAGSSSADADVESDAG